MSSLMPTFEDKTPHGFVIKEAIDTSHSSAVTQHTGMGMAIQKHTAAHSGCAHNLVLLSGYCHISLQMLEANLDEPGDMLQSMSSSADNPLNVMVPRKLWPP